MSINLSKINLNKEYIIDLKKKNNIESSKAQVVLALDYSGSMATLYSNGTVQKTVERILPFGLAFDDNQSVDPYIFHDKSFKINEPVTLSTIDNYVNNNIYGRYKMGGTNYAPILEEIYTDFKTSKGLFGLGKEKPMEYPVYVIFITDGDNFDSAASEEMIRKMSSKGYFIQFIGIGNADFNFLERLDNLPGRKLDNVNFFRIFDINDISDQELYDGIMAEYPEWYKQAKNLKLIK